MPIFESKTRQAVKAVHRKLDEVASAVARMDADLVSSSQNLAEGFGRLDADIVKGFGRLDGDIVNGFGRLDADIVKGFGRLDADIVNGFERIDAALRLLPLASPEQSAANAIVALVSASLQSTREPIEVELPHPFANMTREQWARNIKLWLQHAPTLLADCKARTCPACGSDDGDFIFTSHDGYPYKECGDCGAWFVPLQINADLFERYFAVCPEARAGGDYMVTQEADDLQSADGNRFDAYFSDVLALREGVGGALLDIGCGVGTSLDSASKFGFVATGVEINSAAREIAKRRGRTVFATLSDVPARSFDVISLFESLEHMENPDEVGAFAARALAPGGFLVITVPNLNSPAIRGMRGDSLHINGGSGFAGHMNLFSTSALQRFLARHGFTTAKARGQFSANLFEVVGYHLGLWRGARDYLGDAESRLMLPAKLHDFLNVIGPAVADWERECAMGPILHVIARRIS